MAIGVVALALVYMVLVPPGLPYDEPSHWGYVEWLAGHGTLPEIGNPSVSYEAQMGPVAYVLPALAVKAWLTLGGSHAAALYVARTCGLLPLGLLFAAVLRVVRMAVPGPPTALALAATSLATLNPMVLAMSASVQNDTLALALGCWLLVAVAGLSESPRPGGAAVLGVLAGLVVLTKLTLLPAVALLVSWPVLRWRGRGLPSTLAAWAGAVAVAGWWFVRNLALYGDLTGQAAVRGRLGITFAPLELGVVQAVPHLLKSAVMYLWLPGEYFRGLLHPPAVLALVVLIVTVAVIGAGASRLLRRNRPEALLVVLVAAVSVTAWVYVAEFQQAVAFRAAYMVLPGYAAAAAEASRHLTRRVVVAAMIGLLVVTHGWVLLSIAATPSSGWLSAARTAPPLQSAICSDAAGRSLCPG